MQRLDALFSGEMMRRQPEASKGVRGPVLNAFRRDALGEEQPQHKELVGGAALRSEVHEPPEIRKDHLAHRPLTSSQIKTVALKQ